MAVESGSYDEATLARQKVAAALLGKTLAPEENIRHWTQGLANMAKAGVGGYMGYQANQEAKSEREQGKADLYGALGLPVPQAAAEGPSGFSKIAALLGGGAQDASAPAAAAPMPAPAPQPPQAAPVRMASLGPVPAPVATDRAPVAPTSKVWGDQEAEDAGLYEPKPATAKIAAALAPSSASTDISAASKPAGGILAGIPDDKKAAIAAMLTSNNPTVKALGVSAVTNLTKQDDPVVVNGKLVSKKGNVIYDGGEEKPKWGIVGKDKYGQPVYGYPPSREDAAATAKTTPQGVPSGDDLTNVTGQPYLDQLKKDDPKYASQVQSIIEGRAPYPTGMLLKTPYGQKLAQDVTQADPSFESGNATARVKTRNEFMTGGVGSPAGQITAGNTALQHAGEMSDALERMKEGGGIMRGIGNAGLPVISYAANQLKNKSVQGTPEGAALNDFMTAKNHFSEEVTKFYAGSAGSEAERTRALANLDAAKSLPELRSAIKTEVNLMQGKVNALQDRWKNGMGPLVPEFPLIQPKSQEAIDRVIQRHQASEQPAAAAPAAGVQTATNPQTGEKLMLKDGQWVPMK